jgi:hypothetical protein
MNKVILRSVLGLSILAVALVFLLKSPASGDKGGAKKGGAAKGGASSNAATTSAAAYNTDALVLPANDGKWHTLLTTSIKNPTADDDLFIDVAQVSRITTTTVSSTSTASLISSGNARLLMRVLVDGVEAKPGSIVFDERLMTLTSNLQSLLSLSCTQTPTTHTIVTTSCVCNPTIAGLPVISCSPGVLAPPNYTQTCSTGTATDTDLVTTCSLVPGADQSLEVYLEHTLGHSFGFLAPGIGGSGNTHIVQVQAMLIQATANGGKAQALIGPGTLKINAVNLK